MTIHFEIDDFSRQFAFCNKIVIPTGAQRSGGTCGLRRFVRRSEEESQFVPFCPKANLDKSDFQPSLSGLSLLLALL
jgi:hypothetical protein